MLKRNVSENNGELVKSSTAYISCCDKLMMTWAVTMPFFGPMVDIQSCDLSIARPRLWKSYCPLHDYEQNHLEGIARNTPIVQWSLTGGSHALGLRSNKACTRDVK